MPELPEVETVRRGIAPVLEGARFIRADARRPDLRVPIPENFSKALVGKRVRRVGRASKYLLIYMEDGLVMILHLGMSGKITLYNETDGPPPAPAKHDHLHFETDGGITMLFNDPRRFGLVVFSDEVTLDQHPLIAPMGPEPLANGFNSVYLTEQFARRKAPIKNILLDQKVIAGLGNIYVCEALYRAGVHPVRPANQVTEKETAALTSIIRDVINEAIAAGGSTLKDYAQVDGELGYFQHRFRVYGREGEPCLTKGCKSEIERIVQAARSSFFCPSCQP